MGYRIQKLSAAFIKCKSTPGMYGDGGGLWLQIGGPQAKSWVFRYMRGGRAREMGLGPLQSVSLAEARIKAGEYRKQLAESLDPIDQRKARQTAARLVLAKTISF